MTDAKPRSPLQAKPSASVPPRLASSLAAGPLELVYSPSYQAAIPARHRFPMGKYGAVHRALAARPWYSAVTRHRAVPVTPQQAGLAHDPDYVQRLTDGTLRADEVKRIGLPQNRSVVARAFASGGGTTLACRRALACGWAASLAGGSHHANRAGGRGFCVMNDVGLALSCLLAEGVLARALVIDLDVHQGDGTAEIFQADPRVFTASLHCEANYPFEKATSDRDLGLDAGVGDSGYLPALDGLLSDLEAPAQQADLLVYNAGVDAHQDDRLGRLSLSDAGLAARDAMVFEWARAVQKPLCLVLGGGYDHDIDVIAERHAGVFDRLFAASNRG